jgi:hypothetical protein
MKKTHLLDTQFTVSLFHLPLKTSVAVLVFLESVHQTLPSKSLSAVKSYSAIWLTPDWSDYRKLENYLFRKRTTNHGSGHGQPLPMLPVVFGRIANSLKTRAGAKGLSPQRP